MSKKIKLFSILFVGLGACQMNAGNDFLPTNINCNRCKERDSISKNNSSVLLVNVLSVSVPDRTPTASTSPSPSSSVEPSETPTISPSALPTPTASPTE
jgi:hypothetical protein